MQTYVIVDLNFSVIILMRTMTGTDVKTVFKLNSENALKNVVQIHYVLSIALLILKLL